MSAVSSAGNQPFRWDLVTPDRLGSLLDGCAESDLWFLDELVGLRCVERWQDRGRLEQ
jgi:hypothetical protein